MWLFRKTQNIEFKDTVQHSIKKDNVNEEPIKISSKNEKKPLNSNETLNEQVEKHLQIIPEKSETVQKKKDLILNLNGTTNAVQANDEQYENEKNVEINNCKIEDVWKFISVLEKNQQNLNEKVHN